MTAPGVRYEGLSELIAALEAVDAETYDALRIELNRVGDIVRDDARERLQAQFGERASRSASGLQTRVRPGAASLVVVGQGLRKVTGKRPDWGEKLMGALLGARAAKENEAAEALETGVGDLLRRHGF